MYSRNITKDQFQKIHGIYY